MQHCDWVSHCLQQRRSSVSIRLYTARTSSTAIQPSAVLVVSAVKEQPDVAEIERCVTFRSGHISIDENLKLNFMIRRSSKLFCTSYELLRLVGFAHCDFSRQYSFKPISGYNARIYVEPYGIDL